MKKNHSFVLLFAYILFTLTACDGSEKKSVDNQPVDSIKHVQPAKSDSVDHRIALKMDSVAGIYQVPCYVNGVKMNFIFDTGASNVCISLTEAMFLVKNGYLDDEDLIGKSRMLIADGNVMENMDINLHSIEVAGILLTDVKATIVGSLNAPLLLGQSALRRLGKIEIEGDSVFITPKDGKVNSTITKSEGKTYNPPKFEQIETYWYDHIWAFFGYEGKIDDFLNAAWMANENNMPEQALAYCRDAQKLKKTYKAYTLKGRVYNGQYYNMNDGSGKGNEYRDKAIKNYEKCLDLNEDKEDFVLKNGDTIRYNTSISQLAWLYAYKDSTDRALELGQELYQRNPKSANAMSLISCAYAEQGNFPMAEKWAKQLLDSKLDNEEAYFRLGWIADVQKRYKEAVRYYEKCLEDNPNADWALTSLADIYYIHLNNKDYGIYLWKKAARLGEPYAQRNLRKINEEW